jgi:hypothetical protein
MPRSIRETIRVRLERDGTAPAAFTWQGRRYVVRAVTACWKEIGPWWDGPGERTFFRVATHQERSAADCRLQIANWPLGAADGRPATPDYRPPTDTGIYELCYDHEGVRWLLETVED